VKNFSISVIVGIRDGVNFASQISLNAPRLTRRLPCSCPKSQPVFNRDAVAIPNHKADVYSADFQKVTGTPLTLQLASSESESAGPPPTAQVPRTGADLIRATHPFQDEHRLVSWLLLVTTVASLACSLLAVVLIPWWPLKLFGGIICGLIQVRLFIFYHDVLHGAIFRKSRIAHGVMDLIGFYLVAPKRIWKESHDFHHQNNAKLMGSTIGSFPLMFRERMQEISSRKRLAYRIARHPITIFFGYITIFMFGMVISPFFRNPKWYWSGVVAALIHYSIFALAIWCFGWYIGCCAVLVPSFVAMGVGSYLFYAQHNFPTMKLSQRTEWSFNAAALDASSMFDMGRLMHWFTGNIGYHHVHHLNHRIPFYRLPEAMLAIPELQNPERTSWRIRDIMACFNLFVWDHTQGRMISRSEHST
jgi:omega-6 fatty acid desaturase (delta-12 desaturase)